MNDVGEELGVAREPGGLPLLFRDIGTDENLPVLERHDVGGRGVVEKFEVDAAAFARGDEADLDRVEPGRKIGGEEAGGFFGLSLQLPNGNAEPLLTVVNLDPGRLPRFFPSGSRCGHEACS